MSINWAEHERQYPLELVKEGKVKKIWGNPEADTVCVQNSDFITAFNGIKRMRVAGKGYFSTQISNNCFKYLHMQGIPTHFMSPYHIREQSDKFWARKLSMLPVEFVIRNQPFGSYLDRYPDARDTQFTEPVIEFFEKNDDLGDPELDVDLERETVRRWLPDRPHSRESFIDERPFRELGYLMLHRWVDAMPILFQAAQTLQKGWAHHDSTLVDIKFECGVTSDDQVVIGDSIDADSWRLWRGDDPADPLDRQRFKNGATPEEMRRMYDHIWIQTLRWLPPSETVF